MTSAINARRHLATALTAVLVATTPVAHADPAEGVNPQIHGVLALAEATYYAPGADEIRLAEDRIDHSRVTEAEVDQARAGLENLTDDQINQVLVDNGYDPQEIRNSANGPGTSRVAPIIIWGGLALIGVLVGGGLIFHAQYNSHEEKKSLVEECLKHGGQPVLDSKDAAGLEGTTDSVAAQQEGGYRFECQK